MRKLNYALALLMSSFIMYAQDDPAETKDGQIIIPQEGDWALGIDANPFLNYLGNFIGGTDNNTAPTWNYLTTNQTIMGKYFVRNDMAYRGALRLNFGSSSNSMIVQDRSQDMSSLTFPDVPDMVENEMSTSNTNIALAGGVEWRKGNGRLQGIYGAEIGFALSSSSTTYTYGNELDPGASNPVLVDGDDDFGTGNLTMDTYGNPARVTEMKNGSSFGIGARGFIGAEYFVLPKISLGGEFGWGLVFSSTGTGSTTWESTQAGEVGEQTMETGGNSGFGLDTDNVNSIFGPSAVLRIMFHF